MYRTLKLKLTENVTFGWISLFVQGVYGRTALGYNVVTCLQ